MNFPCAIKPHELTFPVTVGNVYSWCAKFLETIKLVGVGGGLYYHCMVNTKYVIQ